MKVISILGRRKIFISICAISVEKKKCERLFYIDIEFFVADCEDFEIRLNLLVFFPTFLLALYCNEENLES